MTVVIGLIGRKIGMTRMFTESGHAQGVTLLEVGPCVVTDVRTKEKHGYEAVQLGYEEVKEHRASKPMRRAFKKKGTPCFRVLREVRVEEPGKNYKVGDRVTAEIFSEKSKVKVVGTSKGCGFAGAMKRWGFHGAPASHGTSKVHRKPQSAGATDAARVFKGKRSPGRMGNERVTALNLEVAHIDAEKNIVAVKGAVPGKRKSLVIVQPC